MTVRLPGSGITYFVQGQTTGLIKIGITQASCPCVRLQKMQTDSPDKLAVLGILTGNREREIHAKKGEPMTPKFHFMEKWLPAEHIRKLYDYQDCHPWWFWGSAVGYGVAIGLFLGLIVFAFSFLAGPNH